MDLLEREETMDKIETENLPMGKWYLGPESTGLKHRSYLRNGLSFSILRTADQLLKKSEEVTKYPLLHSLLYNKTFSPGLYDPGYALCTSI